MKNLSIGLRYNVRAGVKTDLAFGLNLVLSCMGGDVLKFWLDAVPYSTQMCRTRARAQIFMMTRSRVHYH